MSTIGRNRVWNTIILLRVVALAGVIAGCGGGAEPANPATVTWEPTSLNVTLMPGTSQTLGVALTAAQAVSDITLETSPEIAAWLEASIESTNLEKGQPSQVGLGLRALVSGMPGTYTGTIAVRSGSEAIVGSLPVTIHVRAATSTEVVANVSDPSVDRFAIGPTGQLIVKDEVLVGIDGAVADPGARIREIATDRGALIMGSIPALRVYQLRIPGADETTIETHVDAIAKLPGVDAASLSLLGGALKTPDEGLFPATEWTLEAATGANRHLEFIRAPAAWDITTGGPIPVAVIDDGLDFGHPDLLPNIDVYGDVLKQLLLTDSHQVKPPLIFDGHGTEVAGALCAESKGDGKGIGVVGVAWKCGLRLYDSTPFIPLAPSFTADASIVLRLCTAAGFTSCLKQALGIPRTLDAMGAAVRDGARIVNMSVGFIEPNCGAACSVDEPKLRKYSKQLNGILRKGFAADTQKRVLWILAAGNENRRARFQSPASIALDYPELSDRVIVVGGVEVGEYQDQKDPKKLLDSNLSVRDTNEVPRVSGPGGSNFDDLVVDVAAPWYVSTTTKRYCRLLGSCEPEPKQDDTAYGDTYYHKDVGGTSFAAPQVAGLAVLVMSHHPGITAAQVKRCIVDGAFVSVTNSKFKVIDAVNAVHCALPVFNDQAQDVSVFEGAAASLRVNVTGDGLTYEWRKGTELSSATALETNGAATYVIPSTTRSDAGQYFVVVRDAKAQRARSRVATLSVVPVGSPPSIDSGPQPSMVAVGERATFGVAVTSQGPLSYEWRRGTPQVSILAPGVANSATYTTPPVTMADHGTSYFVVVRNVAGPATSAVVHVTVVPSPPSSPTQMTLTASTDPVRAGQLVQYAATVTNRSAVPHHYVVTVPVPAGMSVATGSISQGASGAPAGCGAAVCLAGSVIQWGNNTGYPATVGAGQSLTVTFVAQVDTSAPPAAGTVIRTTASAAGDATSASTAADVVVAFAGDLSLGVINVPTAVAPGETMSYTLRFGNPGDSAASNLALSMPLPAGTSLVAASDGGTLSNGSVMWSIGTLAAGTAGQRTLVVQAAPAMAVGSAVSVAADLRNTSTGRSLARAMAAATVLANGSTQMTLTASADPVRAGQLVQYKATVINRSAVPHYYTITIPVPAGMSVAAGSISQGASGALAGCGAAVCLAGSVIQWGNNTGYPATVGAGQSLTVTFVAQVDTSAPPAAGTVIRTTASAAGDATSASAAADVVAGP